MNWSDLALQQGTCCRYPAFDFGNLDTPCKNLLNKHDFLIKILLPGFQKERSRNCRWSSFLSSFCIHQLPFQFAFGFSSIFALISLASISCRFCFCLLNFSRLRCSRVHNLISWQHKLISWRIYPTSSNLNQQDQHLNHTNFQDWNWNRCFNYLRNFHWVIYMSARYH